MRLCMIKQSGHNRFWRNRTTGLPTHSFFPELCDIAHSHCLRMSYYVNFLGGSGSNEFHIKWRFGTHTSWKNQNPGGRFGATSQTALPIQPILPDILVNGPNWQCCLAGCSKTAHRILVFLIVLGMAFPVVEFSSQGYKIRKVFG